jgi:radical SAM protein with 4Fe4S-binding SPASM domain
VIPKVGAISLQCNCEPLLNKNIVDIVRRLKQENPNLHVAFATNGTLLSPSISSGLIDVGLNQIWFSIDGASEETYESIRRGAKFEEVIENIKNLISQKELKQAVLPKAGMITVASTKNVSELFSILELTGELHLDSLIINGLEPYDEEMANSVLWGKSAKQEYIQVFGKLERLAREKGIELRLPSLQLESYTSCTLSGCTIDSNGNVYPCSCLSYERPYFYFGEKNVHSRISFGSLKENDLSKIWNSREYRSFRNRLTKGRFPKCCHKCLLQNKVICPM